MKGIGWILGLLIIVGLVIWDQSGHPDTLIPDDSSSGEGAGGGGGGAF